MSESASPALGPAAAIYAEAFAVAIESAHYIHYRRIVADEVRRRPWDFASGEALARLSYWDLETIPGVGDATSGDIMGVINRFLGRESFDRDFPVLVVRPDTPAAVVPPGALPRAIGQADEDVCREVEHWQYFARPGDRLAWAGGVAVVLAKQGGHRLVRTVDIVRDADEVADDGPGAA